MKKKIDRVIFLPKPFFSTGLLFYRISLKISSIFYGIFQKISFNACKNGFFRKIFSIPYFLAIKAFVFFCRGNNVKAIFLRGRVALGEIFPGDSDLDFFIVTKNLQPSEEFGFLEKLSVKTAVLRLLFPFIGPWLALSESEASDNGFLEIYFDVPGKKIENLRLLYGNFPFPKTSLKDLPLGFAVFSEYENSFLKIFFEKKQPKKIWARPFYRNDENLVRYFSEKSENFRKELEKNPELANFYNELLERKKKFDFFAKHEILFEQFFFLVKIQEIFFKKFSQKPQNMPKKSGRSDLHFLEKFKGFEKFESILESVLVSEKPFGFNGKTFHFVLKNGLEKNQLEGFFKKLPAWKRQFEETDSFRIETVSSFFGKIFSAEGLNCIEALHLQKTAKIVFGKNLPEFFEFDEKILRQKAFFELKFLAGVSSKTLLLKNFGTNSTLAESGRILQAKAIELFLKNGILETDALILEKKLPAETAALLNLKNAPIEDCKKVFLELRKFSSVSIA